MAFLYHACQTLGVKITKCGIFNVDIRNGDLEGLERVKIIGLFSDVIGPNAQKQLDIAKLELKEYTKEAVRHRMDWNALRRSRRNNSHIAELMRRKPKVDLNHESEYAGVQDYDRRGVQCITGKIGSNNLDATRQNVL